MTVGFPATFDEVVVLDELDLVQVVEMSHGSHGAGAWKVMLLLKWRLDSLQQLDDELLMKVKQL